MSQNVETRQAIVQLLSNMSDGKEIRAYLQRFSEVGTSRFAVIKIGGAILEEELESTAAALSFLHTVGLTPVVLHGGGPQLDKALEDAGVGTTKIDGLRVTDADTLDVARKVFIRANLSLVEAIRRHEVEAHSLNAGVVEAEFLDREKYGFVGEAVGVQTDIIASAIGSGAVPVCTCLGVTPGGQIVNVNGDAAVRALVHALQPMKIIFLTGVGGLLDQDGELIDTINLNTDYDVLMGKDWVHSGMRVKLMEIKRLLDDLPPSSSVSITKPTALIQELFTHGGAGTLVRKGEGFTTFTRKEDVDAARLAALVEDAFARPLKPGWWDELELEAVHVSDSYRAAAVVSRKAGVSYLDKFAVLDAARGEGLAKAAWRQLVEATPRFFWRSRTDNGFNRFYHDEADGCVKRGKWTVFWLGDDRLSEISDTAEAIAAAPESFTAESLNG